LVQPRLIEAQEADDRQPDERHRDEVREACRGVLRKHTTCQGADDKGCALYGTDPADPLLVEFIRAGFLDHRVVDNAVHGA
jgi:hypothetical protein